MAKYKILAVTESEDLKLALRDRLNQMDDIALVGFAGLDTDLATKIKGYAPHAVLLVQDNPESPIFEASQSIYQGFPGCAVVLMVESLDIETVKTAMQSGVREIISKDNLDEMEEALLKAAQLEQSRAVGTRSDPRVISFYSGRGGSGKTTIAVNSAVALAASGQRTILVDLNLNFGDASLLINVKAKDTIAELVQEKNSFTIDDIRSYSMQHASGISMLCAPQNPEHAEYITPRHVELLVNQLRPYYDFIVIDLPCDINDTTLTAIESSDILFLVTKKDLSGLKATKQLIDIFTTLQHEEKIRLILNTDHKSNLTQKNMEKVFSKNFDHVLAEDLKTTRICQERGTALVSDMPRSALSRGIQKMVQVWIEGSSKEAKA